MYINNLQNGDLLFMRDNSEFSKAIIETTKEYSHVGIFFDGMIYHASRKYGVVKQKLEDFPRKTNNPGGVAGVSPARRGGVRPL